MDRAHRSSQFCFKFSSGPRLPRQKTENRNKMEMSSLSSSSSSSALHGFSKSWKLREIPPPRSLTFKQGSNGRTHNCTRVRGEEAGPTDKLTDEMEPEITNQFLSGLLRKHRCARVVRISRIVRFCSSCGRFLLASPRVRLCIIFWSDNRGLVVHVPAHRDLEKKYRMQTRMKPMSHVSYRPPG